MGSWELCNLPLTQEASITYLYRSPRASQLEPALIDWRRNLNGEPARLDPGGIRHVLGELRGGRTVGILPDQEPDAANGVFAPFFGTPALTMTLVARLAARSGATLFMFTERLPAGRGWRVHYIEPEADIGDRDKLVAATALNRTVERCIAINPTQYNWSYRRFRRTPDGGRRPY